ncbi:RICIN domain-containing protein [Streptomyces sp. NBC_00237]|uniref:RICIN domain-containing protein n=1 Tax=Streptomyces sp. NBC_00237 TaxID=2975687 RepID=UPI00225AAC00|nr:RICIN domain-containing protein [Streptomyces sp. NBC_00237]MCX5200699.1 RICIN domain-containing protein [Streptomyces sp. NBC_00237]
MKHRRRNLAVTAVAAAAALLGLGAAPAAAYDPTRTITIGDLCLDAVNSGTANGTPVQLFTCNDTDAQHWSARITDGLNGRRYLVNVASGKCLDVPYGDARAGVKPQLWDCNRTGSQEFATPGGPGQGGGYGPIVHNPSGLVLDVPDSRFESGARPQLWVRNGTNAQSWTYYPLDATPGDGDGSKPCKRWC